MCAKWIFIAILPQNDDEMAEYELLERNDENGVCLECGTAFYGGRVDRKFCCEACKNRYNNKKTQSLRNFKLRIRTALERNYEILQALVKDRVRVADRADLEARGFNPDYVTVHIKVNRRDSHCCYDISYILTPSKLTNIRKLDLK